MAQPTLDQIKAANPDFFNNSNSRLFGDSGYKIDGHWLTVTTRPGYTHNPDATEDALYRIVPETLEIDSVLTDRGNGRKYTFVQPDKNGPVLTQYLNDDDGTPDGQPTPDRPNQHERR